MVKSTVYLIGSYFLEIWDWENIKPGNLLPRYYLTTYIGNEKEKRRRAFPSAKKTRCRWGWWRR